MEGSKGHSCFVKRLRSKQEFKDSFAAVDDDKPRLQRVWNTSQGSKNNQTTTDSEANSAGVFPTTLKVTPARAKALKSPCCPSSGLSTKPSLLALMSYCLSLWSGPTLGESQEKRAAQESKGFGAKAS